MKKFTKGCLMTALVLFFVGLVLSVVCGLLGGFRQLSEMGFSDSSFGLYRDADGDWRIGFPWSRHARVELEDIEEIEDMENVRKEVDQAMEKKLKELDGKKEQLALTADTLGSIAIDVEDCNVLIQESADENVWFLVEGNSNKPYYTIENERGKSWLRIENEVKHHFGHWRDGANSTVYLWLPKNCSLEVCEIDMGAGYMRSMSLNANQVNITVGAGLLEMDDLVGNDILLSADAGELLAGHVTAETAILQIGAGHLSVEELSVSRKANIGVSVGQCEIAGTITGDLDMECDMGEIIMRLTGSEEDHSYDVECGMGNVTVGNYSHGGFAAEKSWNTGKGSEFDIDCSMGNVTVTFEE